MAELKVPGPVSPGAVANIAGAGFANRKTRLLLDGIGSTTNVFRPDRSGTFHVGITVASSPRTQTLVAQQADGSKWPEVARTSIVVAVPSPVVTPLPPIPEPTPPPVIVPVLKSVRAASVPEINAALASNDVDEIVVPNGTYRAGNPTSKAADSLWIGSQYAQRTRPILVRAETPGGAILDRAGGNGAFSVNGGAHHQTWDGFRIANAIANQTGIVMIGGYLGLPAPHHITLRRMFIDKSCHRVSAGDRTTDHAVYFSYALDTWSDILIEDLTVDATDLMGLSSGIHMDHGGPGDAPNLAAHGVTVRNLVFKGSRAITGQMAIVLWTPPIRDWTFDGGRFTDVGGAAVYFESRGAKSILLKDLVSTNSRIPFLSSMGASPAGVTFENLSLR